MKSLQLTPEDTLFETVHLTERFACLLMRHGHKAKARTLLSRGMRIAKRILKERGQDNVQGKQILAQAIEHTRPSIEVRRVRVAGTMYQTPAIIPEHRQERMAIRWIREGALLRAKGGSYKEGFAAGLGVELADAWGKQGHARKKRDELHKVAEANRAYAHYRWW